MFEGNTGDEWISACINVLNISMSVTAPVYLAVWAFGLVVKIMRM